MNKHLVTALCVIIILVGGAAGCSRAGGSFGNICSNYFGTAACASVWSKLSPTGVAPSPRRAPSVVYDEANDILISFGGTDGADYFNDVFVLANALGVGDSVWTELATSGGPPAPRAFNASAYNSLTNELIIFGGSETSSILMDLWVLSNANGSGGVPTWTNPAVAGAAPSPRALVAFAYDEATDTLILFGGRACGSSSCTLYNDVYLLMDVTTAPTWQQLTPSGTAPAARIAATAVYDATDNRLIVFGGTSSTSLSTVAPSSLNDTWILTNANGMTGEPSWIELSPSSSVERRHGHSAVYDVAQDRMIVFGGANASNAVQGDISILIDSRTTAPTWATYVVCNPLPDARRFSGTVYADTSNRMILFAGEAGEGAVLDDVWVLANANGIPPTAIASISVGSEVDELCDGYMLQLIPRAYDAAGNEIDDFLYYCVADNTAVATVDEKCLVTATSTGTVRITVTINGISEEFILTVVSADGDGGGGDGAETWSGTYEIVEVFNGVWVCTYTNTGNISMSITNNDGKLSGTSRLTNIEETVVSEDPGLSCPPSIHSSEGTLGGEVLGNGNYSFTFFDLDLANVAPFTATISGTTFTAEGTKSDGMSEYTFAIQAVRK